MYNTYEEFIKKEVESFKYYGDFYDSATKYIPDFFRLLCEILDEDTVDYDSRIKIYCAVAYLVIPNDVLPENIYGSEGYVDDVFVLVYVLRELFMQYKDLIIKHWDDMTSSRSDKEDIKVILDKCYDTSREIIDKRGLVNRTLEFAGLKRPI